MIKSSSSERTLSSINLILAWFSHVLPISSTTNLSLFRLYFELILVGAVPVLFCTILIYLLKIFDNSLSSVIVLLLKLIVISLL